MVWFLGERSAVLAVLAPIAFLLVPWLPPGETLKTWFPRSGALMVVFSLLAESRAISTYNILNPSGIVEVTFKDAKEKYGSRPAVLNSTAFVLIALGTFIWGFGDLFVPRL